MHPGRLKAFTLSLGDGADLAQARAFLRRLGLGMFLEPIETEPRIPRSARGGPRDRGLQAPRRGVGRDDSRAPPRAFAQRYPEWRYLVDGDGGDENLKDYPIEENPELTIRSVLHNPMLYQEGWGVGRMKHSLTYSRRPEPLLQPHLRSRSAAGFEGFSPFTRPCVVEVAEAIPFIELTDHDHDAALRAQGRDRVARRRRAHRTRDAGLSQAPLPARGAAGRRASSPFRAGETEYRSQFLSLYA